MKRPAEIPFDERFRRDSRAPSRQTCRKVRKGKANYLCRKRGYGLCTLDQINAATDVRVTCGQVDAGSWFWTKTKSYENAAGREISCGRNAKKRQKWVVVKKSGKKLCLVSLFELFMFFIVIFCTHDCNRIQSNQKRTQCVATRNKNVSFFFSSSSLVVVRSVRASGTSFVVVRAFKRPSLCELFYSCIFTTDRGIFGSKTIHSTRESKSSA